MSIVFTTITFTGMPTLEEIFTEITRSPPASAYPHLHPDRKIFQATCTNNGQPFIFYVQDISIYQWRPPTKTRVESLYRSLGVHYKFNLCVGANSWEHLRLMYFPDRTELELVDSRATPFLESLILNPEIE